MALGPAMPIFGCTVSESFDPTGGDIAVAVTWTVEGSPATAESCAAAGIEVVELRIWEQYEGGDHYTEDEWIVQCSAGSLTTQPVLVPDTYRVGIYGTPVKREDGAVIEGDAGFPPETGETKAAALVEATAEAGTTLSVSLDLSPE